MAKHQEPQLIMDPVVDSWQELPPDPEAMARITALMVAGVEARKAEPSEAQFRLLTFVWGALALGVYLAWDLLSNWWVALHPVGVVALILFACASVVAPFVLVPVLRDASDEGGTSLC